MGFWHNFKERLVEDAYQRDKAAGRHHEYEYPASPSFREDERNKKKSLVKHENERRRRDDKQVYAHGFNDGRYHEREVHNAYDLGWHDRGKCGHYARVEARRQQKLAQQREYEQMMYEYGDGGHGHSRRRHGSGHHHHHGKRRSHHQGHHRAASPSNHGKRIAWKDENRRDWHGYAETICDD